MRILWPREASRCSCRPSGNHEVRARAHAPSPCPWPRVRAWVSGAGARGTRALSPAHRGRRELEPPPGEARIWCLYLEDRARSSWEAGPGCRAGMCPPPASPTSNPRQLSAAATEAGTCEPQTGWAGWELRSIPCCSHRDPRAESPLRPRKRAGAVHARVDPEAPGSPRRQVKASQPPPPDLAPAASPPLLAWGEAPAPALQQAGSGLRWRLTRIPAALRCPGGSPGRPAAPVADGTGPASSSGPAE